MARYGRNKAYRLVCKVCGQPRYEACTCALCETHFLAYMRQKQRAYRLRTRGVVYERRGRPSKAG